MRVLVHTEQDPELFEYAQNRDWFTTVLGVGEVSAQPMIGLISFDGYSVAAAALVERKARVATRKHLVRISRFVWIEEVPFAELQAALPSTVRRFFGLGALTAGTAAQTVPTLLGLRPHSAEQIMELVAQLERPRRAALRGGEILAMEKDAIVVAMDIAGIDRGAIQDWSAPEDGAEDEGAAYFLSGLQQAQLREDQIINHDVGVFGDWEVVRRSAVGSVEFEREGHRLTVINVNRMAVETALGVDLIYHHETYDAFVMVQYKRMHSETVDGVKQAVYRPDANHQGQVENMRSIGVAEPTDDPAEYRLNHGPCYFKLCNPETLDPYTTELLKGMYLPLEYFEALRLSGAVGGTRGGVAFSYENVHRRFSNSRFIDLVQHSWVGSSGKISEQLRTAVEFMVEHGRSVILAVEHGKPVDGGVVEAE
jgi:hypothetical protein